ncbi:MAG: hypothetical protein V2A58_13445 [Planctomycetota bacterium]
MLRCLPIRPLLLLAACAAMAAGCGQKGAPPATSQNTPLPTIDTAAVTDVVEVVSFAVNPTDNSWAILELKVKQGWTGRELVLEVGEGRAIPISSGAATGDTVRQNLEFFLFKSAPAVRLAWREISPG